MKNEIIYYFNGLLAKPLQWYGVGRSWHARGVRGAGGGRDGVGHVTPLTSSVTTAISPAEW